MRIYFEEVQRFCDNRWSWVLVIAIALAALLPLLDGMYWQLTMGEPWGDHPLSDKGLIFLFLFVLISAGGAAFMLLSLKLEMKIDESGIHYRFVPIKNSWKRITKDQIAEYRFEKRFRFFDAGGFGYHRNRFTKTKSFRIRGNNHLYLKLLTGEKLLLGTQNLSGIEWAMKKLMALNEPT